MIWFFFNYTCAIRMSGLPLGILCLKKEYPVHRNTTAASTAKVDTRNPQSVPWFVLTQTKKVQPIIAPITKEKKYQLKYVGMCTASSGIFSSNWSAPSEGTAALIPPAPSATKYRPEYSISVCPSSAFSHLFIRSRVMSLQRAGLKLSINACVANIP